MIPGKASLGISKQLTKLTKKETLAGFGAKSDAQLVTKIQPQKRDIYTRVSTEH